MGIVFAFFMGAIELYVGLLAIIGMTEQSIFTQVAFTVVLPLAIGVWYATNEPKRSKH